MLDRFVESAARQAFRVMAAATVLTQGALAMAASKCSPDNARELASLIANKTAEYFKEASNLVFYSYNGISTVQVQKLAQQEGSVTQVGNIRFYPHLEADSVIQEANNCSLFGTEEVSCQVREGLKTCIDAAIQSIDDAIQSIDRSDSGENFMNGTTLEEITKVVLNHAVGSSWSTTTAQATESNASLWSNTVTAAVKNTVVLTLEALNTTTASPAVDSMERDDDGLSPLAIWATVGGAAALILIVGSAACLYCNRNPSSQVGDAEQQAMIGMNPSSQMGDAEVDDGGFSSRPMIARIPS